MSIFLKNEKIAILMRNSTDRFIFRTFRCGLIALSCNGSEPSITQKKLINAEND
jgi:hypothetical protein